MCFSQAFNSVILYIIQKIQVVILSFMSNLITFFSNFLKKFLYCINLRRLAFVDSSIWLSIIIIIQHLLECLQSSYDIFVSIWIPSIGFTHGFISKVILSFWKAKCINKIFFYLINFDPSNFTMAIISKILKVIPAWK